MVDIARLGIEVDARQATAASDALNRLTATGGRAEAQTQKTSAAFQRTSGTLAGLSATSDAASGAARTMPVRQDSWEAYGEPPPGQGNDASCCKARIPRKFTSCYCQRRTSLTQSAAIFMDKFAASTANAGRKVSSGRTRALV